MLGESMFRTIYPQERVQEEQKRTRGREEETQKAYKAMQEFHNENYDVWLQSQLQAVLRAD